MVSWRRRLKILLHGWHRKVGIYCEAGWEQSSSRVLLIWRVEDQRMICKCSISKRLTEIHQSFWFWFVCKEIRMSKIQDREMKT